MKQGLALMLLFMSSASFANTHDIEEQIQSDVGLIEVVSERDDDGYRHPPRVKLNGQEIYGGKSESVHLVGLYRFSGGKALLISENPGGTGNRLDSLTFLVFNGAHPLAPITNTDFYSETQEPEAHAEFDRVVVDLGYFRQKRKIAVLDSNGLTISLSDSARNVLVDDQCRRLYEAIDACIRRGSLHLDCQAMVHGDFETGGFSGSNRDVWTVRIASHYPGFNQAGFVQWCTSACQTIRNGSYEEFQSKACSP